MSKVLDHTHTYVRWKKAFGEQQYKCDDPDCTHTAPRSLILGKRTICSICRAKDFILDSKSLKLARPRCPDCSNTKEAKKQREVKEKVEAILGGLEIDATDNNL